MHLEAVTIKTGISLEQSLLIIHSGICSYSVVGTSLILCLLSLNSLQNKG